MAETRHDRELEAANISALSALVFSAARGSAAAERDELRLEQTEQFLSGLGKEKWERLLFLADIHHVTVRAIGELKRIAESRGNQLIEKRLEAVLAIERQRIATALKFLDILCRTLQRAGCSAIVIKSLDHWPDFGDDLDLLTNGEPRVVIKAMERGHGARLQPRSWGDRLAGKWNFQVPGLHELVEVHVKCLGQTGEHVSLAERVEQRHIERRIGEYIFPVPAPEEQIVIAALQRMYRHFYMRLCDIANIADLLCNGTLDFAELRKGAEFGSVWSGVATLLVLVADCARRYHYDVALPADVLHSAQIPGKRVRLNDHFLRVPLLPDAARLYGQQLIRTGARGDLRALTRLSLLPPLATAAFLGKWITNKDKGIW
jgi:hypothetical protein